MSTKRIATLAVFAGLSLALVALIHFPIFPAAPFLEYDAADIPIFLITFMYGPGTGLILTAIVSVIQAFAIPPFAGVYGMIMHFLATGTYVLVAGFIYKRHRTLKGAIVAMAVGIVCWIGVMIPANLLITPLFMGAQRQQVLEIILPVILPFNLIKPLINSAVTFLLYKSLQRLMRMPAVQKRMRNKPLLNQFALFLLNKRLRRLTKKTTVLEARMQNQTTKQKNDRREKKFQRLTQKTNALEAQLAKRKEQTPLHVEPGKLSEPGETTIES